MGWAGSYVSACSTYAAMTGDRYAMGLARNSMQCEI
jgi:hypothetical protein